MKPSVAVIGTIFVDYKGFAPSDYDPSGRNLGHVKIVAGGVGRNVAMNLAHLNIDVSLVSMLTNDAMGKDLNQQMQLKGVDTHYLNMVSSGGTGSWLVILDANGALLGSVSQMPDLDVMMKSIVPVLPKILNTIQALVLEIDLNIDLVHSVLREAKKTECKIYAIPGNLSVIGHNIDLLKEIDCFICNDIEAQKLMGQNNLETPELMLEAIQKFANQYELANFVVTMGSQGAVYIDQDGCFGYQQAILADVVDSSGAGDAFFSGTIAALSHQQTLAQAVKIGARVASLVISSTQSDCSELSAKIAELNLL